jgi:hypothetical protein
LPIQEGTFIKKTPVHPLDTKLNRATCGNNP